MLWDWGFVRIRGPGLGPGPANQRRQVCGGRNYSSERTLDPCLHLAPVAAVPKQQAGALGVFDTPCAGFAGEGLATVRIQSLPGAEVGLLDVPLAATAVAKLWEEVRDRA